MSRWRWPALGLATLVVAAAILGARSGGAPLDGHPVERVLLVSLPGVSWDDVRTHDLPALEGLVADAAIGSLSTRIGRRGAATTDAYLTIGAGTRAVAPVVEVAVALDPDETYAGVRTADILMRRLGRVPAGVAYLAAGAAIDLNEQGSFGGEPGRLGDLLEQAGVQRAVIANADAAEGFVSDEPPPDGAYARGAATALMGSDGIVPGGTVGRGLLEDDPAAAFGRRLDEAAVLSAFDTAWTGTRRGVVLVEASDLSRAAGYALRATPRQRRALRDDALARSDRLLAALLERVDPEHDAVLVLSPVSASASPELAITVLRTPEVRGGVLRSATTRRDGYVQLADVAPSILTLLGEEPPQDIEGRSFRVTPRHGVDRVGQLADEADAAGFRDDMMPVVVPTIIGGLALLLLAAWRATRLSRRARALLVPASYTALGVVPATFLAAQLDWTIGRALNYAAALIVGALLVGAGALVVERRWQGAGPLAATGAIVGLFTVDVLLGAPLQVNATFGYSVAVAGRFAGLGNLAFALFGAATVVLSALVVDRYGERGIPAVFGLMVAVVLVEGLPMLGADVGGVLSMVPAFGVTALLLTGRRPGARALAALLVAAGGVVLLFAFVDAARPEGERTHLARLAEHLLDGRWASFADSLTRRLQASFGSAELAAWSLVCALVVGVTAYVVYAARGRGAPTGMPLPRRGPTVAAIAGLVVLATAGLVANDSSIAVPATMLIVVTPVAVLRARSDLEVPTP